MRAYERAGVRHMPLSDYSIRRGSSAVDELARRETDLYREHQQLAQRLMLELITETIRDHCYGANRAAILETLDAWRRSRPNWSRSRAI